ncbi:MAG: Sec-independent protein translocase protein TatB [Pseudomonas sp.]
MFDIGFTELLLIGLVALVVLGPERLPGAIRTAGLWIGRLKRSASAIKEQVEREIGADEIRRQLRNEQILDLEKEMQSLKKDLLAPTLTPKRIKTSESGEPAAGGASGEKIDSTEHAQGAQSSVASASNRAVSDAIPAPIPTPPVSLDKASHS